MSHTEIQAPTTTVPCMLNGQNTTPHIKTVTKTVNVAIGRTTGLTVPCEYWPVTDTDHDYGYRYECIYDPKRITLADAEQWIRTQLAEQGVNVDRFINEDGPDDKGYTLTGTPGGALCPVWPTLCTDTTAGHYDHHNHVNEVTDKRGQTLLDVTFTQFSDVDGDGPARISLGGLTSEDYNPSEVRAKTTELRRLLDQADDIADQVMRMQGTAVPTPADRAFSAALASIDAAFKASQNIGRTRDALRTFVDMTAAELA